MSVKGLKFTALTGGGAGALDARDGADLTDGALAIVMTSGLLYHYELDEDSGAVESSPTVIAPDTNAGTKRWILQRVPAENSVPVGSVIAFIGGYFTSGANAGFTNVLGNTAAAVNAALNADGWYVCDGAALNLSGSPIFNGANRYLPCLTDDRFIVGDTAAGTAGGSNTSSHTHTTSDHTLTAAEMPSHTHTIYAPNALAPQIYYPTGDNYGDTYKAVNTTSAAGSGNAHNHGATGEASSINNMPAFLSCLYIMKAI